MPAPPDVRIATVEGVQTQVVQTDYGLPRSLDELLRQMSAFGFSFRQDITTSGTRTACEALRIHRFATIREGRWFARKALNVVGGRRIPPGVLTLRVEMCRDCGAVCVRDVSFDLIPGVPSGRMPLRRRSIVLGWYSGSRRNARTYR